MCAIAQGLRKNSEFPLGLLSRLRFRLKKHIRQVLTA